MNSPQPQLDQVESHARKVVRTMLLVLVAALLLSLGLALTNQDIGSPQHHVIQGVAPVAIVLIIAIAQRRRHRVGGSSQGLWQALLQDEFRQQSLSKATRAALLAVLVMQIPLGVAMEAFMARMGMVFMGYLTMLIGVIAFLAAYLHYDRDAT